MSKQERFMIIDGSSLIHRAFYALPQLTTKEGIYTNAVYGFLTMLYKIQDDYKPDYITVVFDMKAPTFRHKIYSDYKGHRDKTPSELSEQFPILKKILKNLDIKLLEMEGYEADDIAGTLAKKGEDEGYEVILVTGDKDYLQLIDDNTRVLITKKGITDLKTYDSKVILEEYGIEVEQLVDLKGLMGDSSDNIPGVPGIGEKTGIKLIKEFKSIEGVYENINKVTGKKRVENLTENKDLAYLSRDLGKIKLDVPIDLDIKNLKVSNPQNDELYRIYKRLEFNSLLKKIDVDFEDKVQNNMDISYKDIKDNDYKELLESIKKEGVITFKFLFNEEDYTYSKVLGLGIISDGDRYYIDFSVNNKNQLIKDFKFIFEDKDIAKYSYKIKEDIYYLLTEDVELNNIAFDALIAQYLIDPSKSDYEISDLASEYLDIYIKTSEELLGKGKSKLKFEDIEVEQRGDFILERLVALEKAKEKMLTIINSYNMEELFYEIELPLTKVLASMEYEGFKVDKDVLVNLGNEFKEIIDDLTEKIYKISGEEFNINSPKQLGIVLFEKLELPVIKKTKTGYSTNVEVLNKLQGQNPIIDYILEYRQIIKLKSTYIDGLLDLIDETGRIHSKFNQTVTSTGRISSTEPNLQNIPIKREEGRKIRRAFVAKNENYTLIDGDYSQIELRVLAHISKDDNLLEAFFNDEDIHTRTASQVFAIKEEDISPLMRNRAKAVNFGIIYGISDYGLSRDLGISRKEAKEYIDKYLSHYDKVHDYMVNIVERGKSEGYVETILNRRRYIPELSSKNFNIRGFGERIAMNTPIQGSAADIIKLAMVKVHNELSQRKLKSKLILQVHDELIIETHKDEVSEVKEIMKNIMESCIKLDLPLKVDIVMGDNWYDTM